MGEIGEGVSKRRWDGRVRVREGGEGEEEWKEEKEGRGEVRGGEGRRGRKQVWSGEVADEVGPSLRCVQGSGGTSVSPAALRALGVPACPPQPSGLWGYQRVPLSPRAPSSGSGAWGTGAERTGPGASGPH